MTEEEIKLMAEQLRKPEGELGTKIGARMNKGNEFMNLLTIEELAIEEEDKLLEIGMGNGFFVKNILKGNPTVSYTGVDYSEQMVKESIQYNKFFIDNKQAQFLVGDIAKLPFENEQFTKVFTINTLYFWEYPAQVLTELKRVLTKDGILILSIRPKEIMEKFPVTKYGFTMYDHEKITKLLDTNGLQMLTYLEKIEPDVEIFGEKFENACTVIRCRKK